MAALVTDDAFDLGALRARLAQRLPDYAHPVFVRMASDLALTETFKLKKQALAAEGWSPTEVADPLYFADRTVGAYVPLTPALAARISAGVVRL
jgi:fatty-acyl-CoA synthase